MIPFSDAAAIMTEGQQHPDFVAGNRSHAWSGGDARYEFNDAMGPDASRLILEFVMQYERDVGVIAAARAG